jgi:histidinol phosphatase-like enzyme (inositol monophosphatase family)
VTVAVPAEFVALAHRLADASGALIRPYFRSHVAIDDKSDATPVTIADRGAEQVIRDILAVERPQDGVWGEEFGQHNLDAEWVWVLDPIDGTKAFVTGKPMFATLIGLAHRGVPVLGVIDQPVLRERWIGGVGYPTTFNGVAVTTRPCAALNAAWFNTTTPDMFKGTDEAAFLALRGVVKQTNFGGDAYAYGLLASGFIDLILEAQLKYHDIAALAPVIAAAGGIITDWAGQALTMQSDGRVLAAGDRALHALALALVRGG